jgi:hypothetical protein
MDQELNNILTLIECTVLEHEQPDYIEVSAQNGSIYLLVSKKEYKDMPLYDRIQGIYALIQFELSELLDEYSVIVEALDSDQLKGLFELYGKKSLS